MRRNIELNGKIQLEKTYGAFSKWMKSNQEVFKKHFGAQLQDGSLNVGVVGCPNIHVILDNRELEPAIIIPKAEFRKMPSYLGDGQAWKCEILFPKQSMPHKCWVFRRIGSRVRPETIEILSTVKLVDEFKIHDGNDVMVVILDGVSRMM